MNHPLKHFAIITLFAQSCKAPAVGIASAAILGALLHQFGWYGLVFAFVGLCLALIVYGIVGMVMRKEF